jgi:nucleoid DNA-binding protein
MLKKELVEKISKYFKLTEFEAEKIYDDIFEVIIHGVRDDNIVDVANLGEFIIKYNNGKSFNSGQTTQGYKKTVEFLATPDLEEDINIRFSERVIFTETTSQKVTEKISSEIITEQEKTTEPLQKEDIQKITEPEITAKTEDTGTSEVTEKKEEILSSSQAGETPEYQSTLEEELKKKREEILGKLTSAAATESAQEIPGQKYKPLLKKEVEDIVSKKLEHKTELPHYTSVTETVIRETKIEEEPLETGKVTEEKEQFTEQPKPQEEEDISPKSFADYFTEIQTTPPVIEKELKKEEDFTVIPQSAIDLHKQITGEIPAPPPITQQFAPTAQTITPPANNFEQRDSDNSYYIWYKEAESTPADTQTLSYEYELLYQATKEAEYKSKLKIYVSSFILFFSVVLALLIFSPLIYKAFFKPIDIPVIESIENKQPDEQTSNLNQNQQEVQQTTPTEKTQQQSSEQQIQQSTLGTQQQQTQQQQTQTTPQQQTQTTPQQQTETQKTEPTIAGLSKNSLGWTDEKYKVIYIRLENGKYTIQESAWDSDQKANKRVSSVEAYKIEGLKGSILKVDLGDKGTWFRTRFGEFSTIEEARQKAEELRNKERLKFQAFLFTILLFA